MTMEQMAAFLRRYEQDLAMTQNVWRYASKVGSVEAARIAVRTVLDFPASSLQRVVFCCFCEADEAIYQKVLAEEPKAFSGT